MIAWVFVEACSQKFWDALQENLKAEHLVGIWTNKTCRLVEDGVVLSRILPKQIAAKSCIYLPMGKKRYPDFTKTVSVVCPDHTRFSLDGKQYFPCGYSASACLTISSKSDGKVVLSLLRGIRSLFGREIEPFELPIDAVKTLSDEELLMIYMVKLLLYP